MLANNIFDTESRQSLSYCKLIRHPKYKEQWCRFAANEVGWLAQGIGGGIKFISKSNIPFDRWKDITYVKFVCEYKPTKEEQERTR